MYRVAGPSEYLVITGVGIADIKIAKTGWVLPGQSCAVFDVLPVNYTFEVQAMSAEKLPFILPAVFTIGPKVDDDESLHKYAKLISPHDKLPNHVKELVQGIIEGETRVLAASMTMEEIFRGPKEFKGKVFEKVQLELYQFGLVICNINVKQLVDVPGHEYLAMQRQGEGKKEEIRVRTQVKVYENEREAEVAEANAELVKKKAGWTKEAEVAQVEAAKSVALRKAELQGELERMNALTQTKKLKVEFLSKATVEYETKVQEANVELYRKQKAVEAVQYEKEKAAEAVLYSRKLCADAEFYAKKREADSEFYAKKREADSEFYVKKREAEGLVALAQAQAYLRTQQEALGGNYEQRSAVASRVRGCGVEGERRWRRQGQAEVAASRASGGGVEQRSVVGRGRAAVASSKGQRQRTGEKRTVSEREVN